jgi:hypothetical protein
MPGDERSSRRYSEKEVGLILRRATEFQRSEPSAADPTGLTLAELQEVASEVGIDPAYLRRAAAELVPLMQAATVGQGNASAVGKTLTWSSRSDTNTSSQQILITVRDGETLIRIEERLSGFAGGLYGGLMGGVGGGVGLGVGAGLGGALGSLAFAITFPVIIIGASYLGARGFFAAHVHKRRRQLQDLLDQLAERVEREAAKRTLSPSPPSSP